MSMSCKKMGLAGALLMISTVVHAGDEGLISNAAELGARAGAMNYCKEHAGADASKYGLVSLGTLKKLDELPSDEKAKALIIAKEVEESGEYLGKPLDKERCDSLRKLAGAGDVLNAVK